MCRAVWIDVFNADHLFTDRQVRARHQGFELDQAVQDQAERGGKLIKGRAIGGLADGVRDFKGGSAKRLAQVFVERGGATFGPHLRPRS